MDPQLATPKEKYDLAREQIRHEDELVSNRVTWFLVFQGLLFSAFAEGVKMLLDKGAAIWQLAAGTVVLGLLGMVASIAAFAGTQAALRQIDEVVGWWSAQKIEGFPQVAGNRGKRILGARARTSLFLLGFVLVWALLLILLAIA